MIAELYGKESGCAMGLGGSMHLIDIKSNVVAAVPIVGSTMPIGVGVGWSQKLNGNDKDITVIYFGDGATEEGVFHESLDFASLFNLNILFVCENNFYSVYSNISKRQNKNRSIIKIAKAHGINSTKIDGNDCEEIYKKSKSIINQIRTNNIPHLIELDTYRYLEHCGPNEDDHLNYRDTQEIKKWTKKDPIKNYQKRLLNEKIISNQDLDIIFKKIHKEINQAFSFAKNSPYPNKKSLLYKYIYA
jgi:TPP-dependent pyruvate/acetoin dehydrogenase alpha subunit